MSLLFDRGNRVTRVLKSVEKDALNKAVTVENTYKDELFCIYFVLKLYFYKLKKLTLTCFTEKSCSSLFQNFV